MPLRHHKRKNTYDLRKRLKRRFYKVAAIATLVYVTLSLIKFHAELHYLPHELGLTWAVFLLCYTSFKELLRWNDVEDTETYRGGLWAALVIGGAIWMIGWNIVRVWAFRLPMLPFPDDYQAATIETIVIYTLSLISSFLYKHKQEQRNGMRQRVRAKTAYRERTRGASQKNDAASARSIPSPQVEVVLTEASTLDNKNPPAEKGGGPTIGSG